MSNYNNNKKVKSVTDKSLFPCDRNRWQERKALNALMGEDGKRL